MNAIRAVLLSLGICEENSIVSYFDKVRDRDDISVLKCLKSGVLFLDRSDHMHICEYQEKKDFGYWNASDRNSAILTGHEDSLRRFDQFKNVVANKKWMDVGTGAGGILDLLSPIASESIAVEPQESARNCLLGLGYNVYESIEAVPLEDLEVVTMFHVFEHLTDPLGALKSLKKKMSRDGRIIIEVPHARDFLLESLDLNSFKKFTFWSEHLILHTRESLRVFLDKAGFKNISIVGYQRYPLANHLYWLAKGSPGGHLLWDRFRTHSLDSAYSDMLSRIDNNDTLIAYATNK